MQGQGIFLGWKEPKDWNVDGNSGTTYRASMFIAGHAGQVKVSKEVFETNQKLLSGQPVICEFVGESEGVQGDVYFKVISLKPAAKAA